MKLMKLMQKISLLLLAFLVKDLFAAPESKAEFGVAPTTVTFADPIVSIV